jgi:hypothetical protein
MTKLFHEHSSFGGPSAGLSEPAGQPIDVGKGASHVKFMPNHIQGRHAGTSGPLPGRVHFTAARSTHFCQIGPGKATDVCKISAHEKMCTAQSQGDYGRIRRITIF